MLQLVEHRVHRRTGADTEDHPFFEVFQRRGCDLSLELLLLAHHLFYRLRIQLCPLSRAQFERSFLGDSAGRFASTPAEHLKSYFFLAAFFLAFFLAFAMRVLQLQVSPGTEYIHALLNYKQA